MIAALTFCTLLHLGTGAGVVHSGARGCHQRIIAGHSQQGFSATHTLTFTTAAAAAALHQLPLRDYVSQLQRAQFSFHKGGLGLADNGRS